MTALFTFLLSSWSEAELPRPDTSQPSPLFTSTILTSFGGGTRNSNGGNKPCFTALADCVSAETFLPSESVNNVVNSYILLYQNLFEK